MADMSALPSQPDCQAAEQKVRKKDHRNYYYVQLACHRLMSILQMSCEYAEWICHKASGEGEGRQQV